MIVIVKDFVGTRALTLEDGNSIHDQITPQIRGGHAVTLDFTGVEDVATAFLNTAVGRLYAEFSSPQLSKYLQVENLNLGGQRSLEKVLKYARRHYAAREDPIP